MRSAIASELLSTPRTPRCSLAAMEIATRFSNCVKQKDQANGRRFLWGSSLPTIVEETDETFRERKKRATGKHEPCQHRKKGSTDGAIFRREATEACVFSANRFAVTKHEPCSFLRNELKVSTFGDVNNAKALFPDFFSRSSMQYTDEDYLSSGKAKLTIEQLYSHQDTDFSDKSFHDHSFEIKHWKKYLLLL